MFTIKKRETWGYEVLYPDGKLVDVYSTLREAKLVRTTMQREVREAQYKAFCADGCGRKVAEDGFLCNDCICIRRGARS
jgi:hypothetical protein